MSGTRSGGGAGRHGASKKKVPSSAVCPTSTSTSGLAPGASRGDAGRLPGSTVGSAPPRDPAERRAAPAVASWSATICSASSSRRRPASNGPVPPAAALSACAHRIATAGGWATSPSGGEARTARCSRPAAAGATSRSIADSAPADCPARVTRPGSPPNAAMLSAHPFERGDLVEQAPVRGGRARAGGQVGMAEPAEAAQPVVHGHDHGVDGGRQPFAGVQAGAGMPDREPAAVEPHEHRTATVERRREHVEAEALLVGPGKLSVREHGRGTARLRRRRPGGGGVAHARPARHRTGRRVARRGRVRDPLERDRLAGAPAAETAGGDLYRRHGATARPRPPTDPRPDRDDPRPTRSRGCGARRRPRSRPRPRRPASGKARRRRR